MKGASKFIGCWKLMNIRLIDMEGNFEMANAAMFTEGMYEGCNIVLNAFKVEFVDFIVRLLAKSWHGKPNDVDTACIKILGDFGEHVCVGRDI